MSRLTVTFDHDFRGVTITGVGGNTVRRRANGTVSVIMRKDGGATITAHGEDKRQTVRVDSYGRIWNGVRPPRD